MKSIFVHQEKEGTILKIGTTEKPSIKENELLIEVHTAGVNRTDLLSREKMSSPTPQMGLGIEVAGIVVEVGESESTFVVGDKVMGLVNRGGYAEYVVLPSDRAMKIPEIFTFEQAAAIPEVFLTAYQTLFWHGKLSKKQTVLIHAGGSGVGTAAIQLAKELVDANVITTAGSKEKLVFCKELGADFLINYKKESFDEKVLSATNNEGVDVILDFIGASYWEKNLKSIKKGGHWVLIGTLGGNKIDHLDLSSLMVKYITLTGTLLTPRSDAYKSELTHEFAKRVLPLMEKGYIKPIVHKVFPLEKAEAAQQYMKESRNIGKIILKIK